MFDVKSRVLCLKFLIFFCVPSVFAAPVSLPVSFRDSSDFYLFTSLFSWVSPSIALVHVKSSKPYETSFSTFSTSTIVTELDFDNENSVGSSEVENLSHQHKNSVVEYASPYNARRLDITSEYSKLNANIGHFMTQTFEVVSFVLGAVAGLLMLIFAIIVKWARTRCACLTSPSWTFKSLSLGKRAQFQSAEPVTELQSTRVDSPDTVFTSSFTRELSPALRAKINKNHSQKRRARSARV